MKLKLSSTQRDEIKMYIKNQLDISPLIENYSIAGEDLSSAIIKRMNRPDEDISGVILAGAVIGEEGGIVNLNRAIARGCNFRSSRWNGQIWFRKASLNNTSFKDCFCPYVDFRKADMRGCDICGMVMQVLTPTTMDALFGDDMLQEIAKHLHVDIIKKNS